MLGLVLSRVWCYRLYNWSEYQGADIGDVTSIILQAFGMLYKKNILSLVGQLKK